MTVISGFKIQVEFEPDIKYYLPASTRIRDQFLQRLYRVYNMISMPLPLLQKQALLEFSMCDLFHLCIKMKT